MMRSKCSAWICVVLAQIVTAASLGWHQVSKADGNTAIELHIALKSALGPETPEQVLLGISNPFSTTWRRHLTSDEAAALSNPSTTCLSLVRTWIDSNGLASAQKGGMLTVRSTVAGVEKLLDTEYFVYSRDGDRVVRTEKTNVPRAVEQCIDFITPTKQFPPRQRRVRPTRTVKHDLTLHMPEGAHSYVTRDSCGSSDNTTPDCLRQVYNISYTPQANRTVFAVYGTEAASYKPSDLQAFLQTYNPPAAAAGATFQVIGNGDPSEGNGGIESGFETSLDTQTSLGLAWPAHGVLYNNGGVFGPNGTAGHTYDRFVSFLQDMIHNDTVPSVVSFSESMPEDMVDPAYARRLCTMMAQVGARGVTLLFSSGDNGPNGDQPSGTHKQMFEPEFPASCPYITSVGGTTDLSNETAATKSTMNGGGLGYTSSGGGFSNLFPRPSYQNNSAATYVSQQVPASYASEPGYNASGRGIPDVSAFSTKFPTVVSGLRIPIGGTSASTPTWAAIVAILNDYEASRGRPTLGFLNPWLYQLQTGLKDITTGGNSAGSCELISGCTLGQTVGYNVTVGWDPVTGLGSPNVGLLLEALDRANGTGVTWTPPSPTTTTASTMISTPATASATTTKRSAAIGQEANRIFPIVLVAIASLLGLY